MNNTFGVGLQSIEE